MCSWELHGRAVRIGLGSCLCTDCEHKTGFSTAEAVNIKLVSVRLKLCQLTECHLYRVHLAQLVRLTESISQLYKIYNTDKTWFIESTWDNW